MRRRDREPDAESGVCSCTRRAAIGGMAATLLGTQRAGAAADLDRVIAAAKDIADREGAQAVRLMKGELLRQQLDLETYVEQRNSHPEYTFREHLKSFGGAIEI